MKNIEAFFSPILTPAYRSQYGSANPTAIIAPAIAATLVSTLVAVGMLTSILMSCTETVFYTMSVYFLAAKVTKTRYTLTEALLAGWMR